jgi:ribosomal protein L12E/L44/L45/RPP1/RPP2
VNFSPPLKLAREVSPVCYNPAGAVEVRAAGEWSRMTSNVVTHNYAPVDGANTNIKVFIRARPPAEATESDFLEIDEEDKRKLLIKDPRGIDEDSKQKHSEIAFQYDHVFWTGVQQSEVFQAAAFPLIEHVLRGYNACCFAYGQTSSGKTYSMFGENSEVRGMIPRSVEKLFEELDDRSHTKEVGLVCSFLEIYNDSIRDLGKAYMVTLDNDHAQSMADKTKTSDIFESIAGKKGNPFFAPAFYKEKISKKKGAAAEIAAARGAKHDEEKELRPGLKEASDEYSSMNYEIREDSEGNVFVKDLAMVPIASLKEAMEMIKVGVDIRATHETNMNANSSRSHTVFSITVIQRDKETDGAMTGTLNLIDLAGSERLKKTESTGMRLKEALHINTSLTALSKVIMSLDPQSESSHVPFRDSKLTRVLQNSLGGNSFTTVLAAIHPHPDHYEECLSTLQFANRCRNVRNNPKVNYLSADEDKDRKIKRLQDEVKKLEGKIGEGGGGHGGHGHHHHHHTPMTASNVASMLKKLGIQAETDSSGALIVNGKKMAASELGLDEGSSSTDLGSGSVASGSGAAAGGGMGGGSFGASNMKGMNPEKMRRIVTELKDSNSKMNVKIKEQKTTLDEQGRVIQEKDGEIVKLQTTLKHRDWEYKELHEEKERELGAQQQAMKDKFNVEVQTLVANNKDMLLKQQSVIQSVPDTFRTYTSLLKKTETAREKFDVPIRREFEKHLKSLEESRAMVMANVKSQYEYWLKEKDRILQDFVKKFNDYRLKKSEHLRQCEKEIVHLYEYTEQLEKILDGVEKGKYLVQQKQGSAGRSTTGVMAARAASASGGDRSGAGSSRPGTGSADNMVAGGVVIPRGLKPTNPLKLPDSSHLDLTKKIVAKHKERQEKLEKVKEEAFHKSLHHASLSGTVTADVDPVLQKQIRDLLVSPSTAKGSRKTPSSAGGASASPSRGKRGGSGGAEASEEKKEESKSERVPAPATFPAIETSDPKLLPASWGAEPPLGQSRDGGADAAAMVPTPAPPTITAAASVNTRLSMISRENSELNLLRAEIAELKAARRLEQVSASKVIEELAGNETIQYIRYLESEQERLHKMIKDISTQLHSAKVANSALARKGVQ